ncbi:MAG: hypothetical protein LBF12_00540 [Christensenellaceae bacterium]|jgi:hypothetical protein|nr:hypothetical protein [Christensenellaceae bacterium]
MRNFAEQARIVKTIIYLLVSWALCAAILLVVYLPLLLPDLELTGKILEVEILAKISERFTSDMFMKIGFGAVVGVILFALPIIVLVLVLKKKFAPSPFPDGIDKRKFKLKDHYILDQLLDFFFSGGLTLARGYDAEEVFTANGVHFASIRFKKGSIYVLIDHEYVKSGQRPDRSGYIPIDQVANIQSAKDKIYAAYLSCFKQKPQNPKPRTASR